MTKTCFLILLRHWSCGVMRIRLLCKQFLEQCTVVNCMLMLIKQAIPYLGNLVIKETSICAHLN